MGLHDLFDQSQSQPGAFNGAGLWIAAAMKTLENFFQFVFRDADAVILHGDHQMAIFSGNANLGALRGAGIFYGIVEQIGDDVRDGEAIRFYRRQAVGNAGLQLKSPMAYLMLHARNDLSQQAGNIETLEFKHLAPFFHFGKIQNIVDQRRQPFALLDDDVVILPAARFGRHPVGLQHFRQLANRGERAFKFVRNGGSKIGFQLGDLEFVADAAQRQDQTENENAGDEHENIKINAALRRKKRFERRLLSPVEFQRPGQEFF